jgi:hypothetical protein
MDDLSEVKADVASVKAAMGEMRHIKSAGGGSSDTLYTFIREEEFKVISNLHFALIIIENGYNSRGKTLPEHARVGTFDKAASFAVGPERANRLKRLLYSGTPEANVLRKQYEAKFQQKFHGNLRVSALSPLH